MIQDEIWWYTQVPNHLQKFKGPPQWDSVPAFRIIYSQQNGHYMTVWGKAGHISHQECCEIMANPLVSTSYCRHFGSASQVFLCSLLTLPFEGCLLSQRLYKIDLGVGHLSLWDEDLLDDMGTLGRWKSPGGHRLLFSPSSKCREAAVPTPWKLSPAGSCPHVNQSRAGLHPFKTNMSH